MDKIDNAVRNGIDHAQQEQQAAQTPLQAAMTRHASALLTLNTIPGTSQVGVDPRQLMVDLELVTVRLQVLFLALIKELLIDGDKLTAMLANTLNDEAAAMEAAIAKQPRIMVPTA